MTCTTGLNSTAARCAFVNKELRAYHQANLIIPHDHETNNRETIPAPPPPTLCLNLQTMPTLSSAEAVIASTGQAFEAEDWSRLQTIADVQSEQKQFVQKDRVNLLPNTSALKQLQGGIRELKSITKIPSCVQAAPTHIDSNVSQKPNAGTDPAHHLASSSLGRMGWVSQNAWVFGSSGVNEAGFPVGLLAADAAL
eukprot:CAMPEP_0194395760 /NCGR_PEP_ID=MMETSP0174-20130528/124602_1 /TAXON_ID=216777 /ORGANISM="Proboscia alata, Strain PI-D3" /LENGTH=195 /DNA_ID=CAMNT_0039191731 /DNA_START=1310 /DNA_END=1895 /DNA_ORIENTATION=+